MGMSLWEILVLGVVRLNLDIDYDFLVDHANNHIELRGTLGVRTGRVFNRGGKKHKRQTIVDNVYLIAELTIKSINEILVKAGHALIKKKENPALLELEIKSDSYPVESNIHFLTDINLSWDSARKVFDITDKIIEEAPRLLSGHRERQSNKKTIKRKNRKVSNIHSKKGANYNERL
jgi:IS5 family transposase